MLMFLSVTKSLFKFYLFFIVVQLQLSPFPPLLSPALPTPTSHTQSSPTLLTLSMGPSYMFLDLTLHLLSPIIPFPTTFCYCQFGFKFLLVKLLVIIQMQIILYIVLLWTEATTSYTFYSKWHTNLDIV